MYDDRVRRALLALIALAGCSSGIAVNLRVEPDAEAVAVVFVDARGRPLRVSGPIFLGRGVGRLDRELELADREEAAIVIATRFDAIAEAYPGYQRSRNDELVYSLESLTPGLVVDADPLRARRIGTLPESRWLPATTDDAEFFNGPLGQSISAVSGLLRMSVPVDTEHCRNPTAGALEVFGRHTDTTRTPRIHDLAVIDEDHVLIATRDGVFLVERGGTTSKTEGRFLTVETLGEDDRRTFVTGMDVMTSSVGWRVMMTGAQPVEAAGVIGDGFLWSADFDGTSLSSFRLIEHYADTRIRDGAFDKQGRFAAVADQGRLAYQEVVAGPFTWLDVPLPPGVAARDESRRIVRTDDDEVPWIFGTQDRLHFFGGAPGTFEGYGITDGGEGAINVNGLVPFDASGRAWAGAGEGSIFEFDGQQWDRFAYVPPPRFLTCAGDGTAEAPMIVVETQDLVGDGDYLYMTTKGCTGVLVIERDTGCTSMLTREGEAVPTRNAEGVEVMAVYGDALYVGAEDGTVYEARLR